MIDLIADFQAHLLDLDRADATLRAYIPMLRRMDRELPSGLLAATDAELKGFVLDRAVAKATRQLRRAVVRGFFEFACDPRRRPHLDYNPATYLPSVTVPRRFPRPARTTAVHDMIRRGPRPVGGFFILAAYAGARCIEISALDREDINEDELRLHGKGDKTRLVPTHPLVWTWARQLDPGPVARFHDGQRMSRQEVSAQCNRWLDRNGYPEVTAHMLRHWFGTNAFDATQDLRAVQELLGHAGVGTTQLYVQVSKRQMQSAVAGLPAA